MEETDWDTYGTGHYEKCADCMVHCGYEATAVNDAVRHPLKALRLALRGVRTEGAMAPDIPLDSQRPAEYVFKDNVERKLAEIRSRARGASQGEGQSRRAEQGGLRRPFYSTIAETLFTPEEVDRAYARSGGVNREANWTRTNLI